MWSKKLLLNLGRIGKKSGACKQRPARADPDHNDAAWDVLLLDGDLVQRREGQQKALILVLPSKVDFLRAGLGRHRQGAGTAEAREELAVIRVVGGVSFVNVAGQVPEISEQSIGVAGRRAYAGSEIGEMSDGDGPGERSTTLSEKFLDGLALRLRSSARNC